MTPSRFFIRNTRKGLATERITVRNYLQNAALFRWFFTDIPAADQRAINLLQERRTAFTFAALTRRLNIKSTKI